MPPGGRDTPQSRPPTPDPVPSANHSQEPPAMNKKKLSTVIASAALAASFIVGPMAPANAGALVQTPQFSRYVWCNWWSSFCR